MRKRQRTMDLHPGNAAPADPATQQQSPHLPVPTAQPPSAPVPEDGFINDNDAVDSAAEDEDEEEKPKSDKKAGRRKIKIEFIQDKSRRHITFSKRKAGIMKKAYELSTLTGTQVLLLVVSETGLVYTFTTAKLQPLVTQPEGKNLIQACLNAPHGTLPSAMPVGAPMSRSSGQMNMSSPTAPANNLPGGLSISGGGLGSGPGKDDEDEADEADATVKAGDKRRRRGSSSTNPSASANARGGNPTSPHSPNASIPPPSLAIPPHSQQTSQMLAGSPTSPQQQAQAVPSSPQYPSGYGHHPSHQHQQDHGMYQGHLMQAPYSYPGPGGSGQPLGGLAAAAAQHQSHWPPAPPQVSQSGHYGRR